MSENETQDQKDLNVLQPASEPRQWTFQVLGQEKTYTQKPLSHLRKMRFFALVGATVRQATATGGQGAVADLLSGDSLQNFQQQFQSRDMQDAESFINLAASLLVYVPDFLEDSYCEWLAIPLEERRDAKRAMEDQLTDEDGFAIIQTFIDQNWDAIRVFFGQHLPSIWKTIRSRTSSEEETTEEVDPIE